MLRSLTDLKSGQGTQLRVLMMGGSRVGKSSALAAILDTFVNGDVRKILTAKQNEKKERRSIKRSLDDMKTLLAQNVGKTILVDTGKTPGKTDYHLQLDVPERSQKMNILITDISGELFNDENPEWNNTVELVSHYDVFIVAIDTTFMMGAHEENELLPDYINEKFNCISIIHSCLTNIDDKGGANPKLVIFVPIKCEKWAKEGHLQNVVESVEADYSSSINALTAHNGIQVEIIPVQTAGSIVFKEFREAKKFQWQKPVTKIKFLNFLTAPEITKCSILDDGTVRLCDGTIMKQSDGQLMDDESAVLYEGSDIVRPNVWFEVLSANYAPHNCEQLAFHILDFMLSKEINARLREKESRSFSDRVKQTLRKVGEMTLNLYTLGLWGYFFGSIPMEQVNEIINKMKAKALIKTQGEGITILHACEFRKEEK